MVKVRPITFHSILRFIQITLHPNYISTRLHLLKSFTQFFFILLKHTLPMSYDFRSYLKNPWTDLPLILIGKNKRIVGMFLDWLNKSNLSGSTHMYKYIIANCCKSATFLFEICKTTFYLTMAAQLHVARYISSKRGEAHSY